MIVVVFGCTFVVLLCSWFSYLLCYFVMYSFVFLCLFLCVGVFEFVLFMFYLVCSSGVKVEKIGKGRILAGLGDL